MKQAALLLTVIALPFFFSCTKDANISSDPAGKTVSTAQAAAKGGGGGGSTITGPISFVGGTFKLVGGNSDSIQINLTQTAPAGWVLALSSNDPAFRVPSSFPVPQGAFVVHVPITSSIIASTKTITVTATLLGQSVSSSPFKIFPLHYSFPAPQLQSPGNGSGFKNRLQVKFTWSDNVNAYYHDLQISDTPTFNSTYLDEVYVDNPIWAQSYFNGLGKRYWRVRYIDGSGTPGPWSPINGFEIKP